MRLRYSDVQWAWPRVSDVSYRMLRLSDIRTCMFYWMPFFDYTASSDFLSVSFARHEVDGLYSSDAIFLSQTAGFSSTVGLQDSFRAFVSLSISDVVRLNEFIELGEDAILLDVRNVAYSSDSVFTDFVSEDADSVGLGESLRAGLKSNSEFYLGGSVLGSVALGGHFI